jgi:hypothetical protein
MFSDIAPDNRRMVGAILVGICDMHDITSLARSNCWAEEIYLGHVLYANPKTDEWVACLKSGSFVVGTKQAVHEVIDVELGRKPSFVLVAPYDRLVTKMGNSQAVVSVLVSIPQALRDITGAALDIIGEVVDEHELGPLVGVLKKICLARGFGLLMSRKAKDVFVELDIIANSKNSARVLSASMNLLKTLTRLIPDEKLEQIDIAMRQAFRSIVIERDKDTVSLKMLVPESAINH